MLPNCPQYIIAAFAILRLGAIVVNINPSYTARELLIIAADSGVRLVITLDALAPLVHAVRSAQTPAIEQIIVTSLAEYSAAGARRRRASTALMTLADLLAPGRRRRSCRASRSTRTISRSCSTPAAPPARRRARC